MNNIKLPSAELFTELMAKRDAAEQVAQDFTVDKINKNDNNSPSEGFSTILESLVSEAEEIEPAIIIIDADGQEVSVVSEDDELLPTTEQIDNTIVFNQVAEQNNNDEVAINSAELRLTDNEPTEDHLLHLATEDEDTVSTSDDLDSMQQMVTRPEANLFTVAYMPVTNELPDSETIDASLVTEQLNMPSSSTIEQLSGSATLVEDLIESQAVDQDVHLEVDASEQPVSGPIIVEEVTNEIKTAPQQITSSQIETTEEQGMQGNNILSQRKDLVPDKPLKQQINIDESESNEEVTAEISEDSKANVQNTKAAAKFNKSSFWLPASDAGRVKIANNAIQEQANAQILPDLAKVQALQGMGSQVSALGNSSASGPNAILQGSNLIQKETNSTDIYSAVNFNNQDWEQGLGQRILWMLDGGIKRVAIHIEPPELGPLGIQLKFFDNKANVTFTSHNPEVKGILENATPILENMFTEQGMGLGQVQVNISSQQFSGNRGELPYQPDMVKSAISREGRVDSLIETPVRGSGFRARGLVDYYA